MVSQEFCDTSGFDSEVGQRKGSAKVRQNNNNGLIACYVRRTMKVMFWE